MDWQGETLNVSVHRKTWINNSEFCKVAIRPQTRAFPKLLIAVVYVPTLAACDYNDSKKSAGGRGRILKATVPI